MSRFLGRLGGAAAAHPWRTLGAWLVILVALTGLSPHKLRHGAATLMLTGGASMRAIAEQLGHRNPALTARIYAHVIPEAQRAAVDLLERRQGSR